ncbi:hemolysin family protein [Thalassorhabdomicrobium marinisediminis]|uniref:Magnesium/cobalt efflux protein n=1 Tax=Thalassorhabdomicrobium marinisediminis TaxID=2170577 RepID=A0A2T7FT64_9RHOB|nr:hemolysin family protein [Thalassorhabdomicrobium marinisediminis]PVA05343.1 magnesium/cobalt efflux protein [Thalassorhabdomicrobium marinisediminis]
MGDTTDGSSSAAQRAQDDIDNSNKGGFFSRIVEALSPSDTPMDTTPAPGFSAPVEARGMMNLRRMRVEDVMVPKADIVAVPVTISRDDLVQVFRESGMTRLPVFDGTLDTPIGFVNLKDFALIHGFNENTKTFNLRDLTRTLLFVPPSMPLGVLLQKMQGARIHMALVIDEYGGSDGLVTIEDLIEQVVGEIEDEHDADEDALWVIEKPGVYLAEAKAPLEEFEAEIGMPLTQNDEIDEEEIDSLGGLVFMLAGHVPARGEVIQHPEGPEFEVVEADPRRIKRLRVHVHGAVSG